jgi:two-component system, NtrC family, sensor histidine kinase PilS
MKRPMALFLFQPNQGTLSPSRFDSQEDLARKTQWLIVWRLVFISFFLLLTVLLQEKKDLYVLIALQYFFSIIYIIFLFWGEAAPWLGVLQLIIDGIFVTSVVYLTGGVESFFPYLYFLIILAGGGLFYRLGGLLTAAYACLLYGTLLYLQEWGMLPSSHGFIGQIPGYAKGYFLYQIVMYGAGFFLVAYLGGIFAEQTRKQRTQIEIQRKKLVQLEEFNRIIIENLDTGLITLDHNNTIQSINPAGEKILGRASEDLIHQQLNAIFPDLNKNLVSFDTALGNRLETYYRNPSGAKLILGFSFTPVEKDETYGIGKILSFKDISQIKALEDHLRKVERLALMGKMAAGMAHEIRNPLASISGSIQVLKDGINEEGAGERLLKIISREISKLDSLMNDFLSLAKPVQEDDSQLEISEFIRETVELIKRSNDFPQDITWKLDIEPRLMVNISAEEFSQVLWNLLRNAQQAVSSRGKISLTARRHRDEFFEDWIEIKVRDNGRGISETELSKIFEPFYTTKARGTGLGLSMVQKIISNRGGRIRVDSFPGEGAEFTILFPKRERVHLDDAKAEDAANPRRQG